MLSALEKAEASYKAVYGLVRRLGFRWKRGTKRLNRCDPVARAEFAIKIQRLVDEANRGERTLIYLDEAHIHCDLDEGYGWAWGGEPYEIPSSSPGLSKKVSLYGALVFNDPQVVLWKAERCNAPLTLTYLVHLARVLGDRPKPTIVWDGAPWHRAGWMLALVDRLGFEVVRLPAYSPDFMPVEALWRWLREEVTRNHCHDTIEELVSDVVEFGKRLNAAPLELITRLWPKLELREDELPKTEDVTAPPLALEAASELESGWLPPTPEVRRAVEPEPSRDPEFELLDDDAWGRVRQVLPRPNTRGRPQADQRKIVDASRWKESTGAPWSELPDHYGSPKTACRVYRQWRTSRVWAKVLQAVTGEPDADVRPMLVGAGV